MADWREERFARGIARLPEFSHDQYVALAEIVGLWFQIKAESEPRLTDEQRAYLRQLDPDIWHSALLSRMLFRRKPPLPEPPPLSYSYPTYPD